MSFFYGSGRYFPEVEIIKLEEEYIEFYLHKADLSFANALRRVIIAEVPTMAIDLVNITSNTSPLFDEFISHRIGLLPLNSQNVSEFNFHRDCNCNEFCEKCSVQFYLKEKCSESQMDITSDHIKLVTKDCPVIPIKFKNEDPIIIAKLKKNQELDLHMIAKKGTGKEHAKWSPVCSCIMQHVPEIEFLNSRSIIDNLSLKQKKEFVECCPNKVYRFDEIRKQVEIDNKMACTYCEECTDKLESYEGIDHTTAIKITSQDNRFLFKIETVGSMKPEQIVTDSMNEIKKKLSTLLNFLDSESKNILVNR